MEDLEKIAQSFQNNNFVKANTNSKKKLQRDVNDKILRKFRVSTINRPYDTATFSEKFLENIDEMIQCMKYVSNGNLFEKLTHDLILDENAIEPTWF